MGGSRGDVESFPGTRRDDDDDAKEEGRRQPASNSPSPTRSEREPGEVADFARDKTDSPSPGKARSPESPPKVRSPTRDANSPRSPRYIYCEICQCTVPKDGMKIHREGKRHQVFVKLMRV